MPTFKHILTILSVLAIMATGAVLLYQTAADEDELSADRITETQNEIAEPQNPAEVTEIRITDFTDNAGEITEAQNTSDVAEEENEIRIADETNEVSDSTDVGLDTSEEVAELDEIDPVVEVSQDPVTAEEVAEITVSLTVPATGYRGTVQVADRATVLQVMNTSDLGFSTKQFSGLGTYVNAIGGQRESKKAGMYWILYVNGEKAKAGVSTQTVQDGDIIVWQYEPEY